MHSLNKSLPTPRLPSLALVAATVFVMVLALSARPASAVSGAAQFDQVDGVTVSPGQQTGEIMISWNAASPTPNDYRVSWAAADERFGSLTQTDRNGFPTSTEITVSGLKPGAAYKARVRARYGAQGSSPWSEVAYGDAAHAPTTSNNEAGESADAPLIAAQQQAMLPAIPTTMEECRQQMVDGIARRCMANSFSVDTIRPNEQYHIDWTEWHNANIDRIDHYTVERLRFLYNFDIRHGTEGTLADISATPGVSYVEPGSCSPTSVANPDGSLSHYRWLCDGLANVNKDLSGNVTAPEIVIDHIQGWDTPLFTGALPSQGRVYDAPLVGMRIPARAPQSQDDKPTQAESDDTVEFKARQVVMHMYIITAHFTDGSSKSHRSLITA